MVKRVAPLHEPVPDYMRKLLLMGVRFIDGNTNEGSAGDDSDAQNDESSQNSDDDSSVDEPLGDKGEKALKAERDARKKAEKDLKAAQRRLSELESQHDSDASDVSDGEPTDDQQGNENEPASNDEALLSIARLQALIDYPVPKEYRHLVKGDTQEELEASAKAISQLAARPGVVEESGTGSDSKPGSISEYRAQIRERSKKK